MVRVETRARRPAGATLVEATISADGGPIRVTIGTDLDPVHLPPSPGRPVAGRRLADGRLAVALASPSVPGGTPLPVVETEPAPPTNGDLPKTATAVARALSVPVSPDAVDPGCRGGSQ